MHNTDSVSVEFIKPIAAVTAEPIAMGVSRGRGAALPMDTSANLVCAQHGNQGSSSRCPSARTAEPITAVSTIVCILLTVCVLLTSSTSLHAQGSILPQNIAGGVQFLKSPALSIHRQDISISLDQVTVNYIFINTSTLDLIETMVFTTPNVNYDSLHNQDEEPLQRYTVSANGRNIDYKTMIRPISFTGEDLHDFFSSLGISANPIAAMAQINGEYNSFAAAKRALLKRGLIDPNTSTARWFAKTYYYWQQKFPPAEEIQIQQTYKPNITVHRTAPYQKPLVETTNNGVRAWINKNKRADLKANDRQDTLRKDLEEFEANSTKYGLQLKQYCPNKIDYAALMHSFSNPLDKTQAIVSRELNFNLTYDDNWSSPIEHFTLKIEQPPNTLALLCWPEPMQRIDATTVIYEARRYAPLRDVHLLFVTK